MSNEDHDLPTAYRFSHPKVAHTLPRRQTQTRLWRESNQSLSAPGIPVGKTFAEARDRGGIFGDTSRLRATETALSRVCGCKATER
jgi:hypothetical protein